MCLKTGLGLSGRLVAAIPTQRHSLSFFVCADEYSMTLPAMVTFIASLALVTMSEILSLRP
ncbi:hypothetical protein PGQ11_000948 [Apiospora arundinis]